MAKRMKRGVVQRLQWLKELEAYFPKSRRISEIIDALQGIKVWGAEEPNNRQLRRGVDLSMKRAGRLYQRFMLLPAEIRISISHKKLGAVIESVTRREKRLGSASAAIDAIFQTSAAGIALVVTNKRWYPVWPQLELLLPTGRQQKLSLTLKPRAVTELWLPLRAGWYQVFSTTGQELAAIKAKILEPIAGVRRERVLGIDLELPLPESTQTLPSSGAVEAGYTVPQLSPCHGDLDRICSAPDSSCRKLELKKSLPTSFRQLPGVADSTA